MSRLWHFMKTRDWRIWMGVIITTLWISASVWYVYIAVTVGNVDPFSLDIVGSFLQGAFAPVAFLWLVLGLFIQQRELAKNTEIMHRTALQSEKQTQAIAATEMNARQETFFKISENVKRQLGSISGMLYISSMGPAGTTTVGATADNHFSQEQFDEYWRQMSTGDYEKYSRMFLMINQDVLEEEGGYTKLFYGTDIRMRHSTNFINTFERLLNLARNCDNDCIIEDALHQSGHGLLYQRMLSYASTGETHGTK